MGYQIVKHNPVKKPAAKKSAATRRKTIKKTAVRKKRAAPKTRTEVKTWSLYLKGKAVGTVTATYPQLVRAIGNWHVKRGNSIDLFTKKTTRK